MTTVVQGTPVSDPHAKAPAPAPAFGAALDNPPPSDGIHAAQGGMDPESRPLNPPTNVNQGSKQEVRCRDPIFALLFYANVIAIVAVAAMYGWKAFEDLQYQKEYTAYFYFICVSGVVGLILSFLGLEIMMCIPETLMKVSLIFAVVMAGVWVGLSCIPPINVLSLILSIVFFAMFCCYAVCIKSSYEEFFLQIGKI